ncbi:MAG TPA: cytochrome C oxidase subunit IV family protein [Verrucomicrobiae bacterium]|nr:cytochrome C oxidase subunit IV family protein [Verrucomicrobiae bacterium]
MTTHIVSPKLYVAVFLMLLALTALTTFVAFFDLGPFNTVAAMTIAVVKALLVVLFFMHVRYSEHLVRVFVVAGLFWLAILITLTMSDVLTRGVG